MHDFVILLLLVLFLLFLLIIEHLPIHLLGIVVVRTLPPQRHVWNARFGRFIEIFRLPLRRLYRRGRRLELEHSASALGPRRRIQLRRMLCLVACLSRRLIRIRQRLLRLSKLAHGVLKRL